MPAPRFMPCAADSIPMTVVYALTCAGSDPSGGAGVQVDLRTFAALETWGLSAITALTAQTPSAVRAAVPVDPALVTAQLEALLEAFPVGAAKTGMLATAAVCTAVADALPDDLPLVVDPVMAATSGGRLLDPDAVSVLVERLLPRAALLTPNLGEAAALVGRPVRTIDEMREAAELLRGLGAAAVLVKGGHGAGPEAVDLLVDDDGAFPFVGPRYPWDTHGSGCCLSAAIAARLAQGADLRTAVRDGKAVVTAAIAGAVRAPDGRRMANPRARWAPPCGVFPPPGGP
jgi:hydroxymethylpyrimidine/phosphomethylpyrimidine kinase